MLGRLSRWLRFIGYDVLYFSDIDDREIVRISRAEGRVLLTRDTRLPGDFSVDHLLISSQNYKEQLKQVLILFPPDKSLVRRCMQCNSTLQDIEDKSDVINLVPEHVFINNNAFQRCNSCGSIYWKGSHSRRILDLIDSIGESTTNGGE